MSQNQSQVLDLYAISLATDKKCYICKLFTCVELKKKIDLNIEK